MVRIFYIILLIQMIKPNNEDLHSFRELRKNLKDTHRQLMDSSCKPNYDQLNRQLLPTPMPSQCTTESVNGIPGLDVKHRAPRGQDHVQIECKVGKFGRFSQADAIPLLYKEGDVLIKSHFQHIEVTSIVQEIPRLTWIGMLVTFVDVQEDEAGVYKCSLDTTLEKQLMIIDDSFLLQVDADKAITEDRFTLTEECIIPCAVNIIDSDYRFEESDFLVNFTWYRNSKQVKEDGLHIGTSDIYYKFDNSRHQFTSFLSLFNITESLYGKYMCEGSINLRKYDQADDGDKLQFPRTVKKLHHLRPLHWKKQAKKLASKVLDSQLPYKNVQSMSAKLIVLQQQSQQRFRTINSQLEATAYEVKILSQMVTHIKLWFGVISSLLLQVLIHFWKWVIVIVSAILLSVKMCQYIQKKLKEREMKRNYILLEKISALGLTFRHQCSKYHYDVFISSCEDDQKFVEDQLLLKIQREWQLTKYYSEQDELIGVDIISNMSEKIHKSRKTLVVLSQKFIESSWSVHELCLAYHRKFLDAKDSLVILHLSDLIDNPLELEPLLQGNNYVDFRKGSTEKTWNKLEHALIKGRKSKRH